MTGERLSEQELRTLERPEPGLMTYYVLKSFVAGPVFFVPLMVLWFRYHTLRYRFDEEGISMRWGVLFHREIHLTYSRIQDIHLVSNAIERWLGLARIKIQTASGSAKAEMTIEGIGAYAELRDFLYTRMRGARGGDGGAGTAAAAGEDVSAELVATLRSVAEELRGLRRDLAGRRPPPGSGPDA
ncbi:MAG: PH domain-containing protein [Thermoanaerobaculia bacterium]